MVNFSKSPVAPPSLSRKTSYIEKDVIDQLKNDFSRKCYICEIDKVTGANVEHLTPHKDDEDLKYDWNNLFLACPHCNNIKLAKYDGKLLNCTNPAHDVLRWIKYEHPMWPHRKVLIQAVDGKAGNELVDNTVDLLNKVYNSVNTPIKTMEAENLNERLYDELIIFQKLIRKYFKDYPPEIKKETIEDIILHIRKSSAFTAFKRWVILQDEELKIEFEQYFD